MGDETTNSFRAYISAKEQVFAGLCLGVIFSVLWSLLGNYVVALICLLLLSLATYALLVKRARQRELADQQPEEAPPAS